MDSKRDDQYEAALAIAADIARRRARDRAFARFVQWAEATGADLQSIEWDERALDGAMRSGVLDFPIAWTPEAEAQMARDLASAGRDALYEEVLERMSR
jgi:hypothetical protein